MPDPAPPDPAPTSPRRDALRRRGWLLAAILAALAAVAGQAGASWRAARLDADLRQDLLLQATALARAIHPERARELAFAPADADRPEHRRLCAQFAAYQPTALAAMRLPASYLAIYTVAQRDGAIRFGPESLPPADPRASPPGTVYRDPPPGLARLLDHPGTLTIGPYRDEYGTWVSAFAAVEEPRTGGTLLAVGIDLEASAWEAALAGARRPAWVAAAIALLLALGTLRVFTRPPRARSGWPARHAEALAVLACGLGLTALATLVLADHDRREERLAFSRLAETAAYALRDHLRALQADRLDSMASFAHLADPAPDRFHLFTGRLLRDPAVAAWGWAPRVAATARPAFEAATAARRPGFAITEPDDLGQPRPAAARDVLHPVLLLAPAGAAELAPGRDLGADPELRRALDEAAACGLPWVSPPLRLARQVGAGSLLVALRPMPATAGGSPGTAFALLRPDLLLDSALPDFEVRGLSAPLAMGLELLGPDTPPRPLAARPFLAALAGAETESFPVLVFGRSFRIAVARGPGYRAGTATAPAVATAAGAILAVAAALLAALLVRRHERLEGQVAQRAGELAALHERHRAVVEALWEGILVLDADGRIAACNPAAERILGLPLERLQGRSSGDARWRTIHEDGSEFPAHEHPAMVALRTGEPVRGVVMGVTRPDRDAPVWIRLNAAPIRPDPGAPPAGVVASFHDITSQRADEWALRQAKEQAEALLRTVPTAVFTVDPEHRITTWNRAAEEITGWPAGELLGRPCSAFAVEPCSRVCRLFDGGGPARARNRECVIRHRDGRLLTVLKNAETVQDIDGRVIGGVESFIDISERKRTETELQAARHAAEAAAQAKASFLANMSHEIRTPLTGMMGMTELLLGTPLSPEQEDYARTAHRSGEALLTIINDILDFSKIEADRLTLERIPFDLHRLVYDVIELFRPHLAGGRVDLLVRIVPGTPARALGDPGRVRQILTNLIGNAVKFTSQGHVLVGLSRTADTFALSVADTGVGIPPERGTLLFNPFTQADSSTSRRFGGTGLGLAISRRLAAMMDGDLGFTSAVGVGTTFTARLPLPLDLGPAPVATASAALAGQRVLVVDDNPVGRQIGIEQLAALGAGPQPADCATTALALLTAAAAAGTPFAAALIDQHLPDLDGGELAAAIRHDPALAALPLVAITTTGIRGEAARLEAAGFDGYLAKPARTEVLCAVVAAAIARRAAGGGLITRHSVAEMAGSAAALRRTGPAVRVLLVEDNAVNQKLGRVMLGKLGAEVTLAGDGREAVAATAQERFDLVFMDCQMPELDGFQATAAIRMREAASGGHRLPIIAMTANALAGDRELCLAAGMDDYLAKPVKERDLAAALERWARPAGGLDLDPEPLRRAERESPGMARMVADIFHGELQQARPSLPALLTGGDLAALAKAAHKLKGSSGSLGARTLSARLGELEQAARAGDAAGCRAALAAALPLIDRFSATDLAALAQAPE